MKKIFLICFVLCAFFIAKNKDKVDLDIYNLLYIQHSKEFKVLENLFSQNIIFITSDKNAIQKIKDLNHDYPIFSHFQEGMGGGEEFKKILKELSLVSFGGYQQLKTNPKEFFLQNASLLFDQLTPRFFSISEDFFSLASYSTLLHQDSKISFDLQENSMVVYDGNQKLFLIIGVLKKGYKNSDLFAFSQRINQDKIALMGGNAVFSAYAQHQGNMEGSIMSIIAFISTLSFLFFAFGNLRILHFGSIVIFSLVFGLGASFVILEKIHILSLVMSASLIGIILDFAIHFVCHQENKKIQKDSIWPMKKIFIIGFLIASSGYVAFLFSPLVLLHQIAVISIFSLLGALLFSYFCFPSFVLGYTFQSTQYFESALQKMQSFNMFLAQYKILLYGGIVVVAVLGSFKAWKAHEMENIKNYASSPQALLEQMQTISTLTAITPYTQMIVLTNCSFSCERELLRELEEKLEIYKTRSIAKFLLDSDEQAEVVRIFQKLSLDKEILEIYAHLGINNAQKFFAQVNSKQIQSIDKVLANPLAHSLSGLYLGENQRLILLQSNKVLSQNKIFLSLLSSFAQKHNAKFEFFDLIDEINHGFELMKHNAVFLKTVGMLLAFVLLCFFFGIKQSLKIIAILILGIFFTLGILGFLSLEINIFAIFGLILASAVGIDYVLFAKNLQIPPVLRLKSIVCASITSIISFFVLFFSSTYAVSIFGLTTALGIACIAFLVVLEFITCGKSSKINQVCRNEVCENRS